MKKTLSLLLSSAMLVAVPHGAAFAGQDAAAAPDGDSLAEIVVTAQRRTENLQKVPIAATALTSEELSARGIARLADIQAAAPSLSVTDAGITQAVNIRGIGLASNSPNVTAGVATYVDGLFQPAIVQANSFYDLASVEVLRGPQGTLVGSNSTGGAIFINSHNPDTKAIGGYGEISGGNRGNVAAEGALNLPVASDLAVRAAGFYRSHDSYYDDAGPFDSKAGRLDEKGGRLGIVWQPDSFRALLKLQLNDRKTGGYAYRPIEGTQFAPFRVGDIRTLSFDTPTALHEHAFIASLELRKEFAGGTVLRSLSGYQNKRIDALVDVDGSQAPLPAGGDLQQDYHAAERQYSEEINLISPTGGTIDWIVGGYFQRNDIDVRINDLQAGFPTDIVPTNQRTTTGVFAQGGIRLTPDLQVQLGARWSHYKATGAGDVRIGAGVPGFPAAGLVVSDLAGAHADGRMTGKLALNWTVAPDHLLYAFAARGYKPGGFNSRTSEFAPETVWNYEIGWKGSILDRHVRMQVDGFRNDYSNFQFDVVEPSTGISGVRNISNGTITGVEAQLQGKFGGFGFDASGAYVHSHLSGLTFIDERQIPSGTLGPQCPPGVPSMPPICFDYSGATITTDGGPNLYSPKWTYNVGAEYTLALGGDMTLTPRLNYAYVGKRYTYLAYSPISDRIAAYGLLTGQISLRRGNWHVDIYGTNLAGKNYVAGQYGLNEFYGAPREYGLRAGLTF
jgi:iron complex outermembrane receptor protein